jgi:transcriptional regulator with XRE-family HTH domain
MVFTSADFWYNTKYIDLVQYQKCRTGMNFSGNQLRAARALLGLDQETLAEKVGVSDNTIRNMEAYGATPVGGFASTRDKVREALQALGIEFLDGGEPGVRLRKDLSVATPLTNLSKRPARSQAGGQRESSGPKRR